MYAIFDFYHRLLSRLITTPSRVQNSWTVMLSLYSRPFVSIRGCYLRKSAFICGCSLPCSCPEYRMRNTIWLLTLLGFVGCAPQEVTEQIAVAGHRSVTFKRIGNEFVKAENDRFAVVEAGLTTYRTEGKNFVRWQFTIRPRPNTQLAVVEVEDVSSRGRPSLLIKDEHPQIEELQWMGQSQLVRATPASVRWLFSPDETTRVFRITVTEPDGKRSSVYQATRYNVNAKKKFRILMGPELQRPPER